jgi:hypothetical protein
MYQLDAVEEEEAAEEVARLDGESVLYVREEDDGLAGPLCWELLAHRRPLVAFVLGLSNSRSSAAVDSSQTVSGSGTGAFSIFPSSKPMDLDLNITRDLVRMRGHGGGGPKLGCTDVLSRCCAMAEPKY